MLNCCMLQAMMQCSGRADFLYCRLRRIWRSPASLTFSDELRGGFLLKNNSFTFEASTPFVSQGLLLWVRRFFGAPPYLRNCEKTARPPFDGSFGRGKGRAFARFAPWQGCRWRSLLALRFREVRPCRITLPARKLPWKVKEGFC